MKEYFATQSSDELVKELSSKIESFNRKIESSKWAAKWKRSLDLYYGRHLGETSVGNSQLSSDGDEGELTTFGVNHYRNLIKHVLAMTTSTRPSFEPRAINSDIDAIQQTRLAGNIMDSYMNEKRIGRYLSSAAERSLVTGKGFLFLDWDKYAGKALNTGYDENGTPSGLNREGDIYASAKSPFDVIYDVNLKDWSKARWVIIREYENKWDLAIRYPEYADRIKSLDGNDALNNISVLKSSTFNDIEDAQDLITVYKFFHISTDSVPTGRKMIFLNDNLWLEDGVAPSKAYMERLPVFRITPGEIFDSPEGYSESFDIMVLQEVVNVLYNIPFNNQQAFGIQAVWMPDGCELSTSQIGKGLALLKGGPPGSQPVPLQLTATPAEIFKNIQMMQGTMEKIQGLNSVVTGDPDHNLKSGVALGRMQAMAIQFNSNFQKSWAELNEDGGTFLLKLIQDNAKNERIVALAGKHNRGAMASFTGDSINLIDRMAVDLGNPMSRTASGRIDLADKLLDKGEIDGKGYITVATTGQIDSELESKESEKDLIRKENEMLMDGKPVRAIVGDKHLLHASEHKTVINDPHLRSLVALGDPKANALVAAVTNHIQEHEQIYKTQDPFWSAVAGEPPAPPPPPPPGMGPGGPPPPNGPLPPEQGGEAQPPPVPPMNQPGPMPH